MGGIKGETNSSLRKAISTWSQIWALKCFANLVQPTESEQVKINKHK